jgi:hypothetical protein
MVVVSLPIDKIEEAWRFIEPYARQMAERFPDDWPLGEIKQTALAGKIVLWVVWEETTKEHFGMVATCLWRKPSGKKFLVVEAAAGRDHDKWVHLIPTLEDYGRSHGCTRIEFRGRSGWARRLPDYRLERGEPILSKDL